MSTQTFAEAVYRVLPDDQHRALIVGGTSLAVATAQVLADRGIVVAIANHSSLASDAIAAVMHMHSDTVQLIDAAANPDDLIGLAHQQLGGLTTLINICMPDPCARVEPILQYADELLARNLAAAERMAHGGGGAIVNHCALPVVYAGGELENYVSSLRGAVTGIVRSIARKYGRKNVRCVGVQTALLDIPEVHQWASPAVKAIEVPTKRWGSATECAKLMAFLGLDASYITGQALILDGGLTAGLSGV